MLVVGLPVGALQANCYLVATGAGSECIVIDPGQQAGEAIEQALAEHQLTPVAVLATHGHFDHVASAAEVADARGIAVWIRPEDRHLLADPASALSPELAAGLGDMLQPCHPSEIVELGDGPLELAGLELDVVHTPGHTAGSVVLRVSTPEGGLLAFTGDTLFAGSIGRSDLPGGDDAAIQRSLRVCGETLPDETVVLPGHGPRTTLADERATNPFLESR